MHSLCSTPRYVKGNMQGGCARPAASQVMLPYRQLCEQPAPSHSFCLGTLNSGLAQSSQHRALSLIGIFALHLEHVSLVRVPAAPMISAFLVTRSLRTSECEAFTTMSCSS